MMKILIVVGLTFLCALACAAQWVNQAVATDAAFRGLSVVNAKVVWASGTKGTFIRTVDGGAHWQVGTVPGAAELDFRDVEAFDANTAYLMAAGPGEASRIYKTTDGGEHWRLQYQNKEPRAFFDAMAFWDAQHGMVLSDPVDGRFLLLRTDDGGKTWLPLPIEQRPSAREGQAAFAASGTCLVVSGTRDVWFVTGGVAPRIFHSSDRGQSWTDSDSMMRGGTPSAGAFSMALAPGGGAVIVGGDYQKPENSLGNCVAIGDDRRTIAANTKPDPPVRSGPDPQPRLTSRPRGYRSGVAYAPGTKGKVWVAVGTNGSDISVDGGQYWQPLDQENYNAVAFADRQTGWAVGPKGRVAKYVPSKKQH
jgi:photosystem II stability/assembly factor-like uncharacterized protein